MKKRDISTVILILVFLVGLSLLLYPTVSDWWNSSRQSQAIVQYAEQVSGMDGGLYEQLLADARAYNKALPGKENRYVLSEEEQEEYETLLNIPGTGVIGYIEISKINCYLPIYHGTDEAVLQLGVGHLEGTSLPVGGEGTHSVLSGHRGLPSAKLFTNLDQLEPGDTFVLYVLNETLTYEVDQILIVEPQDMSALAIEEGADYCTLVTCTPYGVNTHRLLVRGRRVENGAAAGTVRVTADAVQLEPMLVASLAAAPMLLILLIVMLTAAGRPVKRGPNRSRSVKLRPQSPGKPGDDMEERRWNRKA